MSQDLVGPDNTVHDENGNMEIPRTHADSLRPDERQHGHVDQDGDLDMVHLDRDGEVSWEPDEICDSSHRLEAVKKHVIHRQSEPPQQHQEPQGGEEEEGGQQVCGRGEQDDGLRPISGLDHARLQAFNAVVSFSPEAAVCSLGFTPIAPAYDISYERA